MLITLENKVFPFNESAFTLVNLSIQRRGVHCKLVQEGNAKIFKAHRIPLNLCDRFISLQLVKGIRTHGESQCPCVRDFFTIKPSVYPYFLDIVNQYRHNIRADKLCV
jgi:hypothetical protein